MTSFDLDLSNHNQDVANFTAEFANLCQQLGGEQLVHQIRDEIKFKNAKGADMVESLAEAYTYVKGKYKV